MKKTIAKQNWVIKILTCKPMQGCVKKKEMKKQRLPFKTFFFEGLTLKDCTRRLAESVEENLGVLLHHSTKVSTYV